MTSPFLFDPLDELPQAWNSSGSGRIVHDSSCRADFDAFHPGAAGIFQRCRRRTLGKILGIGLLQPALASEPVDRRLVNRHEFVPGCMVSRIAKPREQGKLRCRKPRHRLTFRCITRVKKRNLSAFLSHSAAKPVGGYSKRKIFWGGRPARPSVMEASGSRYLRSAKVANLT